MESSDQLSYFFGPEGIAVFGSMKEEWFFGAGVVVKELKELDPNNSTLLVVGAEPSYGKKIKHDIIMGSLNKATYDDKDDISELEKFYRTYHLAQSRWSWKIDGLAAELVYKKGKLVEASTRGNGEVGSDITDNAMAISFIPKNVAKFKNINLTRIRGEIYLPISEYKKNFSHMANPRNAAAGRPPPRSGQKEH